MAIGLVVGNLLHPGSGLNLTPDTAQLGADQAADSDSTTEFLRGIEHLRRLVFRVLAMIMWAAPVGAFGAIAAVVGETGVDALKSLAAIMITFYLTCALFRLRGPRHHPEDGHRRQRLQPVQVPGPGVPAADLVDVIV